MSVFTSAYIGHKTTLSHQNVSVYRDEEGMKFEERRGKSKRKNKSTLKICRKRYKF